MKYLNLYNFSSNDLLNVVRINNQYCIEVEPQDFVDDERVIESSNDIFDGEELYD